MRIAKYVPAAVAVWGLLAAAAPAGTPGRATRSRRSAEGRRRRVRTLRTGRRAVRTPAGSAAVAAHRRSIGSPVSAHRRSIYGSPKRRRVIGTSGFRGHKRRYCRPGVVFAPRAGGVSHVAGGVYIRRELPETRVIIIRERTIGPTILHEPDAPAIRYETDPERPAIRYGRTPEPARDPDPVDLSDLKPLESTATRRSGWNLLSRGRYTEALAAFARTAGAEPEGLPELGAALAAATLRKHALAARSVREALGDEPAAVFSVPLDAELTALLGKLADHYADRLDAGNAGDDALVLAAIYAMLGRNDQARSAIRRAVQQEGSDAPAANLHRLLNSVRASGS